MIKISINDYKESDFSHLVTLVNEFQDYISAADSKKTCRRFHNQSEAETYTKQMLQDVTEREGVCYIATTEEQVIGFILGVIDRHKDDPLYILSHHTGDHGWIGEVYVRPEYRGQGAARLLIEKISEYFKAKGCTNIRLSVLADNQLARKAYDKIGFTERDIELSKDL